MATNVTGVAIAPQRKSLVYRIGLISRRVLLGQPVNPALIRQRCPQNAIMARRKRLLVCRGGAMIVSL
jgi:hypothetical protein